jgi:enterochelin esterase-like enzyme
MFFSLSHVRGLTFLLFAATAVGLGQQKQEKSLSPEVGNDGRVTFRLNAPHAQKVEVHLEGTKQPLTLQKNEGGIWSGTTPPLAPDYYGYSFTVDGVRQLDPSNPSIIPNLLNPSNSLHVPGAAPIPWEPSDIPHGTVHHHFYRSSIIGDNRDFYVYTPPGYDPSASTLYPVLYLFHGFSDDASGWTAVGKANYILDTLIAQNKAKPMVVVMPLGYGAPEILQAASGGFRDPGMRQRNFDNFRNALIDEVMPRVERTYKVSANRESRAIAGLSMGGAESLLTGLNRLDLFSYVGSFSAGGLGSDLAAAFPQIGTATNAQLHLLWIACGTEDSLITSNRQTVSYLKGKGVQLTQIETPGMHTWMVWRRNLVDFVPLLFQSGAPAATPVS